MNHSNKPCILNAAERLSSNQAVGPMHHISAFEQLHSHWNLGSSSEFCLIQLQPGVSFSRRKSCLDLLKVVELGLMNQKR